MKAWFKSKTLWLAAAVGLLGLIQTLAETAPIPEAYTGLVATAIGLAIAALRAVTSKSLGAADG